jgi:hypothetical protein
MDNPTLAFTIANIVVPADGPKTIPLVFDFSTNAEQTFDCVEIIEQGKISYVQTMYVDNRDNPNELTITIDLVRQRISIPAHSQGYYSILAPTPPRFTVKTGAVGAYTVGIHLLNVPIQPIVWVLS